MFVTQKMIQFILIASNHCFEKHWSRAFCKKGDHRNFAKFAGKHLYQSLFFNKVAGLEASYKKETLTKVFSCKFCEIFKNTVFIEHLLWLLLCFL